ncbi:hypothetical protein BKA62DRAFT_706582 [Auriculariales sp. MPI-PUGE-AT-0066]|nr:hypothetical protein BKA62DRAFT_706582 [Auriculariales sp. MPI-PUGE-AT-0066]
MLATAHGQHAKPLHKGRGHAGRFKSGEVIDCDLASYDAFDPFRALSTLRAILVGVQHTHLTMRLDHHKLALHLLGLVEPWLTLSPARNTLSQQPNETLDRVAFYIPNQRDLLSLALCSKRLYSIIFPRHFPYRTVNCKLSNKAVWDHFIAHPMLACNVRRLEIMPECAMDKEIVPPELPQTAAPGQKSSDELVRAAIGNMTGLISLKWLPDDAPPFVVHFSAIWPALRACRSLTEVDVFSNSVFMEDVATQLNSESSEPEPAIAAPSAADFASLGAVTMRSTSITSAEFMPSLQCITQLLADSCINLEIMKIGYGSELGQNVLEADVFFERGRWPRLKTLHLMNIRGTASTPVHAATFLDAHATLEVLHLQIGNALITPNNGALPALRELRCTKDQAAAILSAPSDEPRPLETLRGPYLTGRGADDALLRALDRCSKTLRRIELRGISGTKVLKALAAVAPRLNWLDVAEGRVDSITANIASAAGWVEALSLFPGLTTFHGACFFSEVAFVGGGIPVLADKQTARRNDETAALLAIKCPKLQEEKVKWVVMRTREEDNGTVTLKSKGKAKRERC